ncbi:unnamed protein product [Kuraishia capsulata CBS 1993]|uniref:PH domain-containing protein n=1 Tax=Kuraishia capsulata CBS 1993 TaxID=1382522 RepID=W6ML85_9ASCO|nr:uncharacterized protein KUCA_T00002837001 [Kuraishia capsulata CBS 1993]CDK26863.1 unnamed protein product [Kuraishia capsulata CBS 1993]
MSDSIPSSSTERQVKLIAAGLKELSLDSPTFRASMEHMHFQVRLVENWFNSILVYYKDFAKVHNELRSISENISGILCPTFINQGILDLDYTLPSLENSAAIMKKAFTELTEMYSLEEGTLRKLESFIKVDIREYYLIRKDFEEIQFKFDQYLIRYTSQPKTTDPRAIQQDAYQLYELRKQYLTVSLDLYFSLTSLQSNISSHLIEFAWSVLDDTPTTEKVMSVFQVGHFYRNLQNISHWNREFQSHREALLRDLHEARLQTEENALLPFRPPKELSAYSVSSLTNSNLIGESDDTSEKHGWLFMKTTVNQKEVWVRRWAFLKNGIFGLMNLSPSRRAVQETNKFGILLCNIRYSPEEDRRLCFEIKMIDTKLTFQCETRAELKSWMTVFTKEKRRALEIGGLDGKYAVLFDHFADSINTSVDNQLTTVDPKNYENMLRKFQAVQRVEYDGFSQSFRVQVNTPLRTERTNFACISHAFVNGTLIPTAATANIWGIVNWGTYYLGEGSKAKNGLTRWGISQDSLFPSFYPSYLKQLDVEMKSVFETLVDPDEFCLLSVRQVWAPSHKEELCGRCYFSQNHFYAYTNNSGFISLSKQPITNLVSVQVVEEQHCDVLKIFMVSGVSIKTKLFMDPGKVVSDQINLLIENHTVRNPLSMEQLISKFHEIREIFKKERLTALNTAAPRKVESVVTSADTGHREMRMNYSGEMDLVWDKVYPLPARALLHILVGDQSSIIHTILPFTDPRHEQIKAEMWCCDQKQRLTRRAWPMILWDTPSGREACIEQCIETMVHGQYYNITETTQLLKLPIGTPLRVKCRFIICGLNNSSCKLSIYSKVYFDDKSMLNSLSDGFLTRVVQLKVEKLDHKIDTVRQKLDDDKVVLKALRICGQITKRDAEYTNPIVEDRTTIQIIKKSIIVHYYWQRGFVLSALGLQWLLKWIWDILTSLRTHWVLVLALVVSAFFNLSLMGKTTVSYWTATKNESLIKSLVDVPNVMQRAVNLKDLDAMVTVELPDRQSACFSRFKVNSMVLNRGEDYDNFELKRELLELGVRRNELLTQLKALNRIEANLAVTEWRNWVISEGQRCDFVQKQLGLNDTDARWDDLVEYCRSCSYDLNEMLGRL